MAKSKLHLTKKRLSTKLRAEAAIERWQKHISNVSNSEVLIRDTKKVEVVEREVTSYSTGNIRIENFEKPNTVEIVHETLVEKSTTCDDTITEQLPYELEHQKI
ncbi:hypothetical protein FQR65_LT20154 [Abscondita terminalis]|nr:hypothetical protein FQR65_LT20154 [Abscondita terminalis]